MFRALLCPSSEGLIVLYSIWYRHTVGGRPMRRLRTGRPPTLCDYTRYCIIQLDLMMMGKSAWNM